MIHRTIILSLFFVLTVSADRNSNCTTPNAEPAKCLPVKSCKLILEAIATRNATAIEFAKQSQCGYDTEPLVCCGTTAYPKLNQTNASTGNEDKKPIIRFHKAGELPGRDACGLERDTDRITGGNVAWISEFPWMVLLRYKSKLSGDDAGFKCGGTLINPRYVLTAAHCLVGRIKLEFILSNVRLGEWDYSKDRDCVELLAVEDCSDPVVDMRIEQEIPHPYYDSRTANNDIALLRMEENVEYTDFIRPICLPPANTAPPSLGSYLTVSGWGVTGEEKSLSSVKLKVDVPIVNTSICVQKSKQRVSANQICAGGEKGKDSCSGDSGGPLMSFYHDSLSTQKQWYQEGVVSRGSLDCGSEGYPAIYTRTARYLNWIKNTIHE